MRDSQSRRATTGVSLGHDAPDVARGSSQENSQREIPSLRVRVQFWSPFPDDTRAPSVSTCGPQPYGRYGSDDRRDHTVTVEQCTQCSSDGQAVNPRVTAAASVRAAARSSVSSVGLYMVTSIPTASGDPRTTASASVNSSGQRPSGMR